MGVLDRILGKKKSSQKTEAVPAPPCLHAQLAPRWASAADMGKEGMANEYVCTSCGEHFSPDQAGDIRAREAEVLRQKLATPTTPAETEQQG
jgi:hypothetical protein